MSHLVELCSGTASVSLWALGRCAPPTGFMGSKRKDAPLICDVLGCRSPDRVTLVDAGPWGQVWETVRDADMRRGLVRELLRLDGLGALPDVWPSLLHAPVGDPALDAAQYLCLQARSAGCIPVWWNDELFRWESPTGSRTEEAHQRGGCTLARRQKAPGPAAQQGRRAAGRGIVRIATIAERVARLDCIDWSRVEVLRCDVQDVQPIPRALVYFDPPYAGSPRYAALLPRAKVLAVAQAWAGVAARVVVSEAEPLPLPGWTTTPLRGAGVAEWLTIHGGQMASIPMQLALDIGAAPGRGRESVGGVA